MQSALTRQIERLARVQKLRFDRMMRVQNVAALTLNRSIEDHALLKRTQLSLESVQSQMRREFLAAGRGHPQSAAYRLYLLAELTNHRDTVEQSRESVTNAANELQVAKLNTNMALKRVKKMAKVQESHASSNADALND